MSQDEVIKKIDQEGKVNLKRQHKEREREKEMRGRWIEYLVYVECNAENLGYNPHAILFIGRVEKISKRESFGDLQRLPI